MAKNEEKETCCPMCAMLREFAGSETGKHLQNSHREFLMAVRSMLDKRIKSLGDDDDSEQAEEVEVS